MHWFSFPVFFFVFVFSEAGDLLFMNLCNEGKQPVLEAITHRPKVGLIYIVYIANLISHFVLSLVCKSSWEYMVMVHKFTLSLPTRNIYSIYFYVSCLDYRDSSPLIKKNTVHIFPLMCCANYPSRCFGVSCRVLEISATEMPAFT